MSVTYETDMDLRIGRRLETGRLTYIFMHLIYSWEVFHPGKFNNVIYNICLLFLDVDECISQLHNCFIETTECRNTVGGYTCTCKQGYTSILNNTHKCQGMYSNLNKV
jgi:hypothetical protein